MSRVASAAISSFLILSHKDLLMLCCMLSYILNYIYMYIYTHIIYIMYSVMVLYKIYFISEFMQSSVSCNFLL